MASISCSDYIHSMVAPNVDMEDLADGEDVRSTCGKLPPSKDIVTLMYDTRRGEQLTAVDSFQKVTSNRPCVYLMVAHGFTVLIAQGGGFHLG